MAMLYKSNELHGKFIILFVFIKTISIFVPTSNNEQIKQQLVVA
jgi:hypothetical protein